MTKTEMKKLIKPIVKDCIKEMLLEEGLLSNLISEVMKGQQKSTIFAESIQPQRQPKLVNAPDNKKTVNDARKMLADAIGKGAYENIFEGTTPAPDPQMFSGDEGDPGIDLSMLSNIPGLGKFK